jgi:hypothetical protein
LLYQLIGNDGRIHQNSYDSAGILAELAMKEGTFLRILGMIVRREVGYGRFTNKWRKSK